MSVLPAHDRAYLAERSLAFREVVEGGQVGVILEGFPLPPARFQVNAADILILLPPGYPDTPPDMFHALPHLTLAGTGRQPRATQARVAFDGRSWQRWSRHSSEWRPGIDGLRTMLKRVEHALEIAA